MVEVDSEDEEGVVPMYSSVGTNSDYKLKLTFYFECVDTIIHLCKFYH